MADFRKEISEKHLNGSGVEFGPQTNPLYVNPDNGKVTYVDRLTRKASLELFPELHASENEIIEPDIIMDLDQDNLTGLLDYSFDFFIANHVIEHLINPILFLEDIHEVMKRGAVLYLAVPDKNFIFDRDRLLTSNDHLWDDYKNKERKVSVEHLNDFIINITRDVIQAEQKHLYFDKIPLNWFLKSKLYKIHRKRSIHVHVWDQSSFDNFLEFAIKKLQFQFKIIEKILSQDTKLEMIYVLEKI